MIRWLIQGEFFFNFSKSFSVPTATWDSKVCYKIPENVVCHLGIVFYEHRAFRCPICVTYCFLYKTAFCGKGMCMFGSVWTRRPVVRNMIRIKEKKNTYTQILTVLDLHQICIISKEGACCNMLDIIYLDNYNKRVFECKNDVYKICIHHIKHIFW